MEGHRAIHFGGSQRGGGRGQGGGGGGERGGGRGRGGVGGRGGARSVAAVVEGAGDIFSQATLRTQAARAGGRGGHSYYGGGSHARKPFPGALADVGGDATEQKRWLERRVAEWTVDQLISEFANEDRHGKLWKSYCKCDDVDIAALIVDLLGKQNMRLPTAKPLFDAWQAGGGYRELDNQLLQDDFFQLYEGDISQPMRYAHCLRTAHSYAQAIESYDAISPAVIVKFSSTISCIQAALKYFEDKATFSATELQELLDNSNRKVDQLKARRLEYQRQSKLEAEKKEVAAAKKARLTYQHSYKSYLDDPEKDLMFMDLAPIPTADELLTTETALLPRILAPEKGDKATAAAAAADDDHDDDEEEDGDEGDDELAGGFSVMKMSSFSVPRRETYRSRDHLLNTHYLLLRQECFEALRRGIQAFRTYAGIASADTAAAVAPTLTAATIKKAAAICARQRGDGRINVYLDATVTGTLVDNTSGVTYTMKFTVPGGTRIDWSMSNRFMTGNLLCLSDDGSFSAGHIVFATVNRPVRPPKNPHVTQGWIPTVVICVDEDSRAAFNPMTSYVIVESPVFFEAFRHTLLALRRLQPHALPFEPVLLGKSVKVGVPAYVEDARYETVEPGIRAMGTVEPVGSVTRQVCASDVLKFPGHSPPVSSAPKVGWKVNTVFPTFPAERWDPMREKKMPLFEADQPLNPSQRDAIELALSKSVALIQGPPGTGKTHVGILISRLLLANKDLRRKAPIVFVCQTNHALDQILGHVFRFDKSIIRLGGRSQSPLMHTLSLHNQLASLHRYRDSKYEEAQCKRILASVGLTAAMEQRKCSFDADKNECFIPNTVLARLNVILSSVAQNLESIISPKDVLQEMFASTSNAVKMQLTDFAWDVQATVYETAKYTDAEARRVFRDEVNGDVSTLLLHLAMSPHLNLQPVCPALIDCWRSSGSKAHTRKIVVVDDEGFQSIQKVALTSILAAPTALETNEAEIEHDFTNRDEREFSVEPEPFSDTPADAKGNVMGFDLSMLHGKTPSIRARQALGEIIKQRVDTTVFNGLKPRQLELLRRLLQFGPNGIDVSDSILVCKLFIELLHSDAEVQTKQYSMMSKEAVEVLRSADLEFTRKALQSASIIGMTTTGAAKNRELLESLHPQVVLVEEAAEVLESHILATLSSSVQHLILIGDHQQLRPQVTEYDLVRNHDFDVSLFERLIRNGVSHVTLDTQWRMHPEISSLITPTIYTVLRDNNTTMMHPPVRGMAERVAFLSHRNPEDAIFSSDGAASSSKRNTFEASMIVELLLYLLLNGYEPKQLVVLSMYLGQLRLIRKLAEEKDKETAGLRAYLNHGNLTNVRMSTTDNFQGEEKDVVLLSLVRSNSDDKIGFLSISNRINVALSRARHGLYVIGNFDLLTRRSPLWSSIVDSVAKRGQLNEFWRLRCSTHSSDVGECVSKPEHFKNVALGGCKKPCGERLKCGHLCTLSCHARPHSDIICREQCQKPRPPGCIHKCDKPCGQECGACRVQVLKPRFCGHIVNTDCSDDPDGQACSEKCGKKLPCGHDCNVKCHYNSNMAMRYAMLDVRRSHPKCMQPCNRPRSCGHACKRTCSQSCGECDELVARTLPCGHSVEVPCSQLDLNFNPECEQQCSRKLACGHNCPLKCNEPCGACTEKNVLQVVPVCRNTTSKHSVRGKCGVPVEIKVCTMPCKTELPCGHLCKDVCHVCYEGDQPLHMCHEVCMGGCKHKPCVNECGDVCTPCEACDAEMSLQSTAMLDVMKCGKALACGHVCCGIEGEECPHVCPTCHRYKYNKILESSHKLLGTTESPPKGSAQALCQLPCKHIFTVAALDAHVKASKWIPTCPFPQCYGTIAGVNRYNVTLRERAAAHAEQLLPRLRDKLLRDRRGTNKSKVYEEFCNDLRRKLSTTPNHPLSSLRRAVLAECLLSARKALEAEALLQNLRQLAPTDPFVTELVFWNSCLAVLDVHDVEELNSMTPEIFSEYQSDELNTALGYLGILKGVKRTTIGDDVVDMLSKNIQEGLNLKAARRAIAIKAKENASIAPPTAPPTPTPAAPHVAEIAQRMRESGATALHIAAALYSEADVDVQIAAGIDLSAPDNDKSTPLHAAATNCNAHNFKKLLALPDCRWEKVNADGKTAIDIAIEGGVLREIAEEALGGITHESPAGRQWAKLRQSQSTLTAMDELMELTGTEKVKLEALSLLRSILTDKRRAPDKQVAAKQQYNFMFLGNPGTGKTTVARILGKLLKQMGLRSECKWQEKTGQQLLDEGAAKFAGTLQQAMPGVLFIDEVYQLAGGGGSDGAAITNNLLSVMEEKRDQLTVIFAGYCDDVYKWLGTNAGLQSRIPFEFTFEDFNESELRRIFLHNVHSNGWELAPPTSQYPVDIATIIGRRLARSCNQKGFANARSVRKVFEKAQRHAGARMDANPHLKDAELTTIVHEDVLGRPLKLEQLKAFKKLMDMRGLQSVKRSIEQLLTLVSVNIEKEGRGETVQDVSLHRLFLGNPGTGKTSVAKIYGQVLKELGLLSKGDVIVHGASKLIGNVVGSTQTNVNGIIDQAAGKVLVIDEAYILANSVGGYGKEALDTIVERVQGTAGEDFAVIMCGYRHEMEEMLRTCNPGLKRRFQSENPIMFEDYSDEDLAAIAEGMAKDRGYKLPNEVALMVVHKTLARERAKPHFGNAGSVRNLLDAAVQRLLTRDARSTELQLEDFAISASEVSVEHLLDHLVGAPHIKEHILKLQKRIRKEQAAHRASPTKVLEVGKFLQHYVFAGPPGTGKTTVARAFGAVFHELGLLADPRVVEVKAQDLLGSYVGQTKDVVNKKMTEARGRVLFIDEAYGLNPRGGNAFAVDAVEALLANMTHDDYKDKILIIIAGYEEQMDALLSANPGLRSRFSEKLCFKAYSPQECVTLLQHKLTGLSIDAGLHAMLLGGFEDCLRREGWANARDVETIARGIIKASEESERDTTYPGRLTPEDIAEAFREFTSKRPLASAAAADVPVASSSSRRAPQLMPTQQQVDVGHNRSVAHHTNEATAPTTATAEESKVQVAGGDGDDTLSTSLERALAKLRYSTEGALHIVTTREFPDAVLECIAADISGTPSKIRESLLPQCPRLQVQFQAALDAIREEEARQIELAERIKRAVKEEAERLQREEAAVQAKLRLMGKCVAGFDWIRQGGGYRCAGGSHYISDAQLAHAGEGKSV